MKRLVLCDSDLEQQRRIYVLLNDDTWRCKMFSRDKSLPSIRHEIAEGLADRYGDDPREWPISDKPKQCA